jgi:hypothetical protein
MGCVWPRTAARCPAIGPGVANCLRNNELTLGGPIKMSQAHRARNPRRSWASHGKVLLRTPRGRVCALAGRHSAVVGMLHANDPQPKAKGRRGRILHDIPNSCTPPRRACRPLPADSEAVPRWRRPPPRPSSTKSVGKGRTAETLRKRDRILPLSRAQRERGAGGAGALSGTVRSQPSCPDLRGHFPSPPLQFGAVRGGAAGRGGRPRAPVRFPSSCLEPAAALSRRASPPGIFAGL